MATTEADGVMITDKRLKELMSQVGMPNSLSLLQALRQCDMEARLQEREARVVPDGWALTKLKSVEAACRTCGRAVAKDKSTGYGFPAPCGNRVARVDDCGTVDCLAMLTAAPEPPVSPTPDTGAGGWLPIESAPKDVAILVWDTKSGVNVSYFTVGVDRNSDEPRDGWFTEYRDTRDEAMLLDGPVTHWMPLPDPPEAWES